MDENQRRAFVRELNATVRQLREMDAQLGKMEAHEGDDGTPEDVDGQLALIDEIAAKRRRVTELRALVYPKAEG